ncbi:hypothetical protein [Clostridium sp. BJN0013]|uniref:hypothetical protein n=1 Tax=Clostridium sp. BJN0013 TaxID=3236840 RepID=UPI0034C619CD
MQTGEALIPSGMAYGKKAKDFLYSEILVILEVSMGKVEDYSTLMVQLLLCSEILIMIRKLEKLQKVN